MSIDKLDATSFGIVYQGADASDVAALAAAPHEVLILEPLNLAPGYDAAQGAAAVDQIQAGGPQVFLYMSVGETSDLRRWWDPAWTEDGTDVGVRAEAMPDWITEDFTDASLGAARRLDPRFRLGDDLVVHPELVAALKNEIDFLVGDLGADGVFFDNVASYFEAFEQSQANPSDDTTAAEWAGLMSDLVKALSDHARALNPNVKIIANGDPFLMGNTGDPEGKGAQFLDAISAMLQESVYFANDLRLPNTVNRDALAANVLAQGTPVLAVDYFDLGSAAKAEEYAELAAGDGFLAYADETGGALDSLQPPVNRATEAADRLFVIASGDEGRTIDPLGGDDVVFGTERNDTFAASQGDDVIFGGAGDGDLVVIDVNLFDNFAGASENADGSVTVTLNGGLATERLHDVEEVLFTSNSNGFLEFGPARLPVRSLLPSGGPDLAVYALEVAQTAETAAAGVLSVKQGYGNLSGTDLSGIYDVSMEAVASDGSSVTIQNSQTGGATSAGALGGFARQFRDFALPDDLAPGIYGVRVTVSPPSAIDADPSNNSQLLGNAFAVGATPTAELLLDLSTFAVGSPEAVVGGQVEVSVDVRNIGNAASGASVVRFEIETRLGQRVAIGDIATPVIDPGGRATVAGALTIPESVSPQFFRVRATADGGGVVTEVNEANNFSFVGPVLNVRAPAPAELSVTLADPPETATAGGRMSVSFAVSNDGDLPNARTFSSVQLVDEDGGLTTVQRFQLQPIDPGATRSFTFGAIDVPLSLAAGDYAVRVTLDEDGILEQANRSDDVVQSFARVAVAEPLPDLRPSIDPPPAAVIPRDGAQDYAFPGAFVVHNNGDGASAPTTVDLLLVDEAGASIPFLSLDVPSILPRGFTTLDATAAEKPFLLAAGTYSLSLSVDPDELVEEADERDNVLASAGTLTVLDVPADLTASGTIGGGPEITVGGTLAFDTLTENRGAGLSDRTVTEVRLRNLDDGTETRVGVAFAPELGGLGAGGVASDFAYADAVVLPGDFAPGRYELLVIADANAQDSESDETNNAAVAVLEGGGTELVIVAQDDLVVRELAGPAAALRQGESFGITAELVNLGFGALPDVQFEALLVPAAGGEETQLLLEGGALALGAPLTIDAPLIVPGDLAPGEYDLLLRADPATLLSPNPIEEADETNNEARLRVTVLAAPDVTGRDLALADPAPVAGGPLDVLWTYSEENGAAAAATEARVFLVDAGGGTVELGRRALQPLEALGSRAESFRIAAPAGLVAGGYALSIEIDPDGALGEVDRADNLLTLPFELGARPNAAAAGLALDAPAPAPGGTIAFSWTLTAEGAALPATTYEARLIPDAGGEGVVLQERALAALVAEGEARVEERLTLSSDTSPGGYVLQVRADSPDTFDESDESDNVASIAVTIPAPETPKETPFTPRRDVVTLSEPGAARALGGADEVRGGGWNDRIFGGGGNDDLFGRGGNDRLSGGSGSDDLFGGRGADVLLGGGGRDRLEGGRGDDLMVGGGGRDVFVMVRGGGEDRIRGWEGRDRIDLTDFGFAGIRAVFRRLDRDGRDAELDLPGRGDVTLLGVRPGALSEDDFLL